MKRRRWALKALSWPLAAVGKVGFAAGSAGYTLLLPKQAVELNAANQAELERVQGIGPDLSRRILESRNEAEFAGWDDFMRRLSGVGPMRAQRLSEAGLVINGQSLAKLSLNGR